MNSWKALVNFIQLQRSARTIDLEKTHESYIHNNESVNDIIESKHIQCRGSLLKDSLYVEFLGHFKDFDPENVNDEEIRKTLYYQDAKESLKDLGHFRGNKTEAEILAQARYFLNLFQAIKNKTFFSNYSKFSNVGINHSREAYAEVIYIPTSDYYLVYDGHHRLACYYVAGKRFVKVRLIGDKQTILTNPSVRVSNCVKS